MGRFKTVHFISHNSTQRISTIRLTTENEYVIGYEIIKYEMLNTSLFCITVLIIEPFGKRFDDGNLMKRSICLQSFDKGR